MKLKLLLLFILAFFLSAPQTLSAPATNIVISEVQIGESGTGNATKEFVELYNPTSEDIVMEGWLLQRKTATGTTIEDLVSVLNGTVPAHGYFLIAHEDFDSVSADVSYSVGSIANNNTIILYSDEGQTVVDKIGLGSGDTAAQDSEGTPVVNPALGGSVERKACAGSTPETMANGDSQNGNGEDSDDNSTDFVLRDVSDPQNSSSTPEISSCTEASPSPTPTSEPTLEPTESPEPTNSPTPESPPSATATPKAAFNFNLDCHVEFKVLEGRYFKFALPRLVCSLVRS